MEQLCIKLLTLGGYGNYIIMKDSQTGMGFLYGHLHEPSNKNIGDSVQIGEQVGLEGTTGSSTGIHLHLEMQDISEHDWIYRAEKEVYTNPATFMGIPNVEGISVIYYGTPIPPTPIFKNSNKWLKARSKKIVINF